MWCFSPPPHSSPIKGEEVVLNGLIKCQQNLVLSKIEIVSPQFQSRRSTSFSVC